MLLTEKKNFFEPVSRLDEQGGHKLRLQSTRQWNKQALEYCWRGRNGYLHLNYAAGN